MGGSVELYVVLLGGHCDTCGYESQGYNCNLDQDGNEIMDSFDPTMPVVVKSFPVKIWARECESGQWDLRCPAGCGGRMLAELEPGGVALRTYREAGAL